VICICNGGLTVRALIGDLRESAKIGTHVAMCPQTALGIAETLQELSDGKRRLRLDDLVKPSR